MITHNGSMAQWRVGDCRETLKSWAASGLRARTCVTSPPYFGLRDYGHDGQLGLEATPEAYVSAMVDVFRDVRNVLTDDGTLWLNIGDSYANDGKWGGSSGGKHVRALHGSTGVGRGKVSTGLKPKDLIGIPWMLAFALRADGWYLRQEIIWHKPNPMPESVRDRCTKAHESIFLFAKSERYFMDPAGLQEPCVSSESDLARAKIVGRGEQAASAAYLGSPQRDKSGGFPTRARAARDSFKRNDSKRAQVIPGQTVGTHRPDRVESDYSLDTRNKRSVWSVATRPYPGSHFAVYPPALIEPCIQAGSAPGDIVLDPFGGSGTTAGVALKHGRHALLCELNAEYAALMPDRIRSIVA